MVVDATHFNDQCCFDYGNAEVDNHDDGRGTMEAVYFGSSANHMSHRGSGEGPWIMVDLEDGLWAGNEIRNPHAPSIVGSSFVTALAKGGSGFFALKGGDAQAGELTTLFEGSRPRAYTTMRKQGAIILGIGGDNSNGAVGTFYEGVLARGYTTDATDDAVQANIVGARTFF